MRNAISKQIATALALTTDYQTVAYPSDLGAVIGKGGQVVLTFKRTGGTSITFSVEEYFDAQTGWVPMSQNSAGTLSLLERTSTMATFSWAFTTLAEQVRVKIKGAGGETADVLLTVGEVI